MEGKVLRSIANALVIAAFMLLVPASAARGAEPARTPRRHALLIGVQSYAGSGSDWQNLDGPVNDVRLIRELLVARFGFHATSIRSLEDGEATTVRIRQEFDGLIGRVRTGDIVYIHYSGHGSRVKDANGDEENPGFDSSLVPADSRKDGASEILDDEIRIWLSRLASRAAQVVLVVDACHSGTITRQGGALKVRVAPTRDTRDYSWSKALVPELNRAGGILDSSRVVTRISACLDPEWANEYQAPDGMTYGFLTWNLARALMSAAPGQTWESVFRSAEASMSATFRDRQHPRFEGVSKLAIFGGQFDGSPQIAVLSADAASVRLRGGVLNGVTRGSIFERIVASGDTSRIEIIAATAFESTARLKAGPISEPGGLYTEVDHRYPFPPVRIRVRSDHPKTGGWPERLAQSVRRSVSGAVVADSGAADMLLVLDTSDGASSAEPVVICRILDALEQPYGGGSVDPAVLTTHLGHPSAAESVARKIAVLLRNQSLLKFAAEFQTSGPGIELEVLHLTGAAGPADRDIYRSRDRSYRYEVLSPAGGDLKLPVGSRIAFRVRNGSSLPCYTYFVNVTPAGKMQTLFPPAGGDDRARVPAGGVSAWGKGESPGWVVELTDAGLLDGYVCFMTDGPAPLAGFDAPGLADVVANRRGASDSDSLDYNGLRATLEAVPRATRGAGGTGRLDPRTKTIARTITIRVTP